MSPSEKRSSSSLVRALLAGCVFYFAMDLSAGDRGVVDFVVLGLIAAAILWNLVQLGRRMYADGGGREVWWVTRTVMFWVVGLFNTVWIRPADVGSWKNWIGWLLIVVAVVDTFFLLRKERSILAQRAQIEADH